MFFGTNIKKTALQLINTRFFFERSVRARPFFIIYIFGEPVFEYFHIFDRVDVRNIITWIVARTGVMRTAATRIGFFFFFFLEGGL
jgi:hypothetical protein